MKNIEIGVSKEQDEDQESIFHGDLLEKIFAHTPIIDLVCASFVSKSWQFAVFSSLSNVNKVKPWLLVHTTNLAKKITTHAFDPRSNTWVEIFHLPYPIKKISPIQSLGSTLIYEFSSEGLFFSMDCLYLAWHHIPPPKIAWRVDPIIAVVGPYVIVAGGDTGFWDDPLTVEMYDMEASHWSTCKSMPSTFKNSSTASWVSIASNQQIMYVMEKTSGITHIFTPKTKTWSGPYDLRPDPSVYFSVIGFSGDDLIIAGLMGNPESVLTLKIWKINYQVMEFDEIGEIPIELLEKLKGEDCYFLSSITLLTTKDFFYLYNTSNPAEIIFCEINEKKCKWGSVKNLVLNDESKLGERMVMSCSSVGIANLQNAMNSRNLKFVAKSYV
ncbi:unnamed protein product [Amaranthus hypochondriacus]